MARTDRGRKRIWRFRLNEGTILEVSAPEGPTEKQVRRRGRVSLVLMTLAAAVAAVGVALADNTISDGDGLTPIADNNMVFATPLNCGVAATKTALIEIKRNGAYDPGTQVFKKGTTATVTVLSVTPGVGLSAVMNSSPAEITIPSDWDTADNNDLTGDPVSSTVTVNSSTPGAGSGTVTYRATGVNPSNSAIQRDDSMSVSWTVLDNCVTNRPPNPGAISGDSPVNEGSQHTYTSNASDPDSDPLTYAWSVAAGNATINGSSTGSSVTLDFSDGYVGSTATLHLVVSDDHGHSVSPTDKVITINNVAPTGTFNKPSAHVNEGSSFSLSITGVTDAYSGDTPFTYRFDCGTGYGAWGSSNSVTCNTATDGPATLNVKGEVRDKDLTPTSEYTGTVEVDNVAPTTALSSGNTLTWDESGSAERTFSFSVSDPGADTYSVTSGYPSCGTGGTYVAASLTVTGTSGSQTGSFNCKFLDGPATPTVSIGFTDSDSAAGNVATQNVTVNNVAPDITAFTCPTDPIAVGATASFGGTFTDPGWNDTPWTPTFDFGDTTGVGSASATNGSGTFSGSHVYAAAGIYTPSVILKDKDDDQDTATCSGYIVVYDPSAGFVTGGGWIYSEAGNYRPDTTLAGKATFGFVSKYKKGATVPEGNTEFQFHVANLNFKSTSYEWLVVAGSKAMYKGVGTINGSGNYGFLLSAIDGSPDKFRIKIWDKNNSDTVVYDTLPADSDDTADPSTALGGGSIVIHTGKK